MSDDLYNIADLPNEALEELNNHVTIGEELAREYAKKVDEVIEKKLAAISYKALETGELELYDILKTIDKNNVEGIKERLDDKGYFLHVEIPQNNLSIEQDESTTLKATMNPNEIKVKVYKQIMTM